MKTSDIAQSAVDVGSVSQAASKAVADAVEHASPDTGIEASALESGRAFLVQVLIDNSGSMRGFEQPVRDAFFKLKEELLAAAQESDAEVLISVALLHGGVIQPYCRVEDCIELTDENHVCDGGTPLYGSSNSLFGTLMTKVAELAQSGRTAQTFTALISDGQATDGSGGPEQDRCGEPGFSPEAQLHSVVTGMTTTKQHIICGVAIGGQAVPTFQGMGINRKWILDPEHDGFAFDAALAKVSRASRSASKGAGAFQTVANEGFR